MSKRARRLMRPIMHMPRKLSLGWAAQTAIQSRSQPFQSAPPWATWLVGSSTASHPAACMYVHTPPILAKVFLYSVTLLFPGARANAGDLVWQKAAQLLQINQEHAQ